MAKRRNIAIIATSIVITIVVIAAIMSREHPIKATGYITEPAALGSIRTVVNATGTIQPVVTVQIGSQVSGQIQAIYADFNSIVKRGQILAKIDPRDYESQLANAQAKVTASQSGVRSAEANVATASAGLVSAQAGVKAAMVATNNTATMYARARDLSAKGIISTNDLDDARVNAETASARFRQAEAEVEQAQAKLNSAEAQLQQAKAQLQQSQAQLEQAKVNLEYTTITSPVDGVVIARQVDVGQTIAASVQAPNLFSIVNDLAHMQVSANIDEADIGNIASSADVRFTVDAFPNETFRGRIHEIRLSPTTAQNVVTYKAILDIDNPELKLKPGMTANITITVDRRDNVLKIPNAALRYAPAGQKVEPVKPADSNPFLAEEGQRRDAAQAMETAQALERRDLAPGQKWDPAQKVRLDRAKEEILRTGKVWVLNADQPEQRAVLLGITDGTTSEVVSGALRQGENVIVGEGTPTAAQRKKQMANPLIPQLPRMPGGGRRGG